MSAETNAADAALKKLVGPTFLVRLAEIDPDDLLNPRIHFRGIEELAKGQKNADTGGGIVVVKHRQPKSGFKWELAAGGRSFRARRANGTVECEAREFTGTEKQLHIFTGTSNLAREDLTSYEKAAYFAGLKKKFKLDVKGVHAEVTSGGAHISYSQVANLLSAFEELIIDIREAWKNEDGRDVKVTDRFIFWVRTLPKEAQQRVWEKIGDGEKWESVKSELESSGELGGAKKKRGKKKSGGSSAPAVNIRQVRAVVEHARISEDNRHAMLRLIRFLTGESRQLQVGDRLLATNVKGKVVTQSVASTKPPPTKKKAAKKSPKAPKRK
jgi:hypothetical protein